jgi:hypothetical protein
MRPFNTTHRVPGAYDGTEYDIDYDYAFDNPTEAIFVRKLYVHAQSQYFVCDVKCSCMKDLVFSAWNFLSMIYSDDDLKKLSISSFYKLAKNGCYYIAQD